MNLKEDVAKIVKKERGCTGDDYCASCSGMAQAICDYIEKRETKLLEEFARGRVGHKPIANVYCAIREAYESSLAAQTAITDPKRIEKLCLSGIRDGYWKSLDPLTESLYVDLLEIEAKINEIIDKPCECGKGDK